MCKQIVEIAPRMGKQPKLKVLNTYLTAKGLTPSKEDDELTQIILAQAAKLADRKRVLEAINASGTDFGRDDLKAVIFAVLLQEETFSAPEHRLEEKVIEFEKALVKRSKGLDLTGQEPRVTREGAIPAVNVLPQPGGRLGGGF